ncbi:MAG TPA: metallophosphoesterase [Myxococcota bacterium]|jgi:UDP-2,3-diacylglucosamine pyrophosphatase LpxH|nr:metallophosphoesterase [Myxococcota bacterium]
MGIAHGVRSALLFSDVHLGWAICSRHHARWLRHLPEAAGDAELIVLNGDIVDTHRGVQRAEERELVEQLVERIGAWRREGRRVVYLEGNHDLPRAASPWLRPEGWSFDFETARGERVRVLHGHRFSATEILWDAYDRAGRSVLALENFLYGRASALRALYRFGPGWLVSAVCRLECSLARRAMPALVQPLLGTGTVLVHGHTHYGPGHGRIGDVPTWRTGSWVSPGHLGTVDRMLRYRAGRFERIGWSDGRWRAFDDGR